MCQEDFNDVVELVEGSNFGIVTCDKLVVRNRPDANSDIVSIIDKESEVVIYDSESTDEFYAICTATGAEGFCMKQFIAVR